MPQGRPKRTWPGMKGGSFMPCGCNGSRGSWSPRSGTRRRGFGSYRQTRRCSDLMAIADDDRLSAMATRLEPIEISAHPEGAIVSIRAVVQLPSGPIPSPEEFRENCQAGTDQLLQAIPKLIPALLHW